MEQINKRKPLIIDTDPGIDDAVAIGFALFEPTLDVQLITTVAGNVDLKYINQNVLNLLHFWKKPIPVASGAAKPLMQPLVDASDIHGKGGLKGYDFASHNLFLNKEHAIEAMRQQIESNLKDNQKTTIMAIGPLTNIALLLTTYPHLITGIAEIVMMGGALGRGNKTVLGEFNIATDPEAAKIVFETKLPLVLVPLEIGQKALLKKPALAKMEKLNETSSMFYQLFKNYRGGSWETGLKMYDACALAYLVNPDMYEKIFTFATIETQGALTRGSTLIDLRNYLKQDANITVCTDIDVAKFETWFFKSLKRCN